MNHPAYVHIPDSTTEGVRAYREPAEPHPLQRTFLTEAGEKDYIDRLRSLLTQGKLDEADRRISAALAPFDGNLARLIKATPAGSVLLSGWDELSPILEEYEGPPITGITVGLTNEPDLVFDGNDEHEPSLVLALYSDDRFPFSTAPADAVLAECLSDSPAFAGAEEDVEFYAALTGLAPLNTALIQSKHRYFLRDGRDGVEGRAPGGYVEYVMGTWVRALRFLQALDRAAHDDGLPDGARLIAGTFGLHTDFAALLDQGRTVALDKASSAPAPVAALTMKKWEPKPDPLADMYAPTSGPSLRQRIAHTEPEESRPETEAEPDAETIAVAPRSGFIARLFNRLRRR
nr:hypothetical protein [uncultured Sphingomonas sp.]